MCLSKDMISAGVGVKISYLKHAEKVSQQLGELFEKVQEGAARIRDAEIRLNGKEERRA